MHFKDGKLNGHSYLRNANLSRSPAEMDLWIVLDLPWDVMHASRDTPKDPYTKLTVAALWIILKSG